jgi:hypothetical protein
LSIFIRTKGAIMGRFAPRGLGRWEALLVLLVPLGTSGCGGSGTVSGKVLYNGKPLKGGNVTFVGKRTVSSSIKDDGTYNCANVPAGEVTICVETDSLKPAGPQNKMHYKPPPGQQAPGGFDLGDTADAAKRYVAIPPKYKEPDTSPLKYTVRTGAQEKDISLD